MNARAHGQYLIPLEAIIGDSGDPFDVDVTFNIQPFVPAKISGPPEECYPAEGGYAEDERYILYAGPSPDGNWNPIEVDRHELEPLVEDLPDIYELYDICMEVD